MRPQFLQAIQQLCRDNDALFILDEVQTGLGLTGTTWAYQQLGLEPDIVAFAKKAQLGGIMAGRRVDEVPDNVFEKAGRINSTWGGGLVDMVRSRRLLEIIERDGLVARAADLGAILQEQLVRLRDRHPALVSNVRGRGLMCALDLPDAATRDEVIRRLYDDERVLALGCGPSSVRFRPALTVTADELASAVAAFDRVLSAIDPTEGA
jgi:L-lysine 6-transaminase